MRRLPFHFLIPFLGAVIVLTSCETSERKRVAAPPPQAQAPTIVVPPPAQAKPRKVQAEKPAYKPDPIEQLIAAAEKEYQAGRANYQAGHLEAAKDNFDRAFDMLLQGPGDIRKDDRLRQQFDKIVEGVHQLELQALKEGDGFTETPLVPAPIEEANEVTFPVDPNIKAKAEAELKTTQSDLPLVLNDAVAAYINYFSSRGKSTLEHGYVRSGRYRDMIVRTLKEAGVPQDLMYLAQAESGFHPMALSRAGARGMWQFMAGTGVLYGMRRSWWIDDRQDPLKSTQAAARHLKDLYDQFGDWYLAMAAYNSGAGTVQRAVERTGYADFWELYRRGVLPAETRNYVPIILAITIMSKNEAQYGLDRLKQEPPLPFESVEIDYPMDLRLAAECVDTSVSVLQELNPSLLRLTTPKDQKFDLHLPTGTVDKFNAAIAAIPQDMRVSWRFHRVTSGDTLAGIARKYRTTVEAIETVNSLSGETLKQNAKLIIPVTPGRARETTETATQSYSKRGTRYKVRKGDTVLSVADRFNVPVESVRKWNHLKGNSLKAGRMLTLYRPVASATSNADASESEAPATSKRKKTVASKTTSTRSKLKRVEASEDDEAEAKPSRKTASAGKSEKKSSTTKTTSASTSKKKAVNTAKRASKTSTVSKSSKKSVRTTAKRSSSKSQKG